MLNDQFLANCFGSDDDDDEKFEIKHKKERKVAYHPNMDKSSNKKRIKTKIKIKIEKIQKKIFPQKKVKNFFIVIIL